MILAFVAGDKSCEDDLVEWLSNYAHGALWALGARLTTEEREDYAGEMLTAGLTVITTISPDMKQPAGWVLKSMRHAMNDIVKKACFRLRAQVALLDLAQKNPTLFETRGLPIRRQCKQKDKYRDYE